MNKSFATPRDKVLGLIRKHAAELVAQGSKGNPEYELSMFRKWLPEVDVLTLSKALQDLVAEGRLNRVVRLESPGGGGIAEYKSVLQVPSTVLDSQVGQELDVTPDHLKVVFVLTQAHLLSDQ